MITHLVHLIKKGFYEFAIDLKYITNLRKEKGKLNNFDLNEYIKYK